MNNIEIVGFDADDTLWENEPLFALAEEEFVEVMKDYAPPQEIRALLHRTEVQNLELYGYGIKSFTLSMFESALALSQQRLQAHQAQRIIQLGRDMMQAPVVLLPHVEPVLERLAGRYPLAVITKGDLLDQERKVRESGLRSYFDKVQVVSHKTPGEYAQLLQQWQVEPSRFVMVGNSLRSDVIPVLDIGGWGVHVPFRTTWAHEQDTPPTGHLRYKEAEHLGQLPEWLLE